MSYSYNLLPPSRRDDKCNLDGSFDRFLLSSLLDLTMLNRWENVGEFTNLLFLNR